MLRDKNLVPLSRQHQHALALCVRLDRALHAGDIDLEAWQSEIHSSFDQEICTHFVAEEKDLFPLASRFPKLRPIVDDLLADHAMLRDFFARAASRLLKKRDLQSFVRKLSTHIRKEERDLFESMQGLMSEQELAAIGGALEVSLQPAAHACTLRARAQED